jgi:hypothetical protein
VSTFSTSEDNQVVETRTLDVASVLSPILTLVIEYSGTHGARSGHDPAAGSRADLET